MRMTCFLACVAVVFSPIAFGAQARSIPPAQRPVRAASGQGVIMGYVYWDGNSVRHSPLDTCSGLSVTVSVGGTALGTFSSGHFAYITDVGTLSVCAYAIDQMPVGKHLEVEVSATTPAAFAPSMLATGGSASINITGGTTFNKCSKLPSAVPSAADLSQSWYTCASHAYNVNFLLTSAKVPPGANRMAVGKVPPGEAQTIFGCSFGNASPMKGGAAGSPTANARPSVTAGATRVVLGSGYNGQDLEFKLNTQSWSDDSIVFAVPNWSSNEVNGLVKPMLVIFSSDGRATGDSVVHLQP
jgi:hypothetical protein